MPGFLLHAGATVTCAHQGPATDPAPFARVRVMGQPVAVQPPPWVVSGCSLPPVAGGPCVSATWLTAALRVRAGGQPVLLQDSLSVCAPTGTPLQVKQLQNRVKGQ